MSGDKSEFSEVMRSPYDDDGASEDGEGDLAWKPPVTAAIIGALLVSAYVIYAIVAGPTSDQEDLELVSAGAEAVQSTELPPGFTTFPSGNGARIEVVSSSDDGLLLGVTSAAAGSEVPSEVPPDQIAYWELQSDAGVTEMEEQLSAIGVLGNTTVAFELDDVSGESQLVAYGVVDVVEHASDIETPPSVGLGETDFSIEVEPGVTVDGVVTIGDGWGYVDWSLAGGVAAKLDVLVTFVGTDDPGTEEADETRLIPGHLRTLSQGIGAVEAAPLYGFDASYQLYRVGEPLNPANEPTSILIEFNADVVVTVGEPVLVGLLPDN